MPKQDKHIQQQIDDYWQAVADVAENVVEELEDSDTDDRDELLTTLIHEQIETHQYVVNDELQIHTLLYSSNPSAGLFIGTIRVRTSTESFPFGAFAADAFEMDVAAKVKDLLEDQDG